MTIEEFQSYKQEFLAKIEALHAEGFFDDDESYRTALVNVDNLTGQEPVFNVSRGTEH